MTMKTTKSLLQTGALTLSLLASELSVKFVNPMPSQYTARSIVMN
ncbi:hypothetical protein SAMN05421553_2887 [Pseudomonas anguilliseptica]|uniref:Uncharacterized protein n=1 Tax=Pseudomonas anguilliseptica TaxID=53406 RepID=A0A1H5BQU9_PSEAG|nr:hypothetical protein SAMN05421553_2887 [Pseudomonas anguilliseptica]